MCLVFQSRIALSEQLKKGKELSQKVGPSLNETDSDDSNDEEINVPEQVIDPDNPWLAERKEFSDFMDGYKNFVQTNSNDVNKNDQNKNTEFTENKHKTIKSNVDVNEKNINNLNDDVVLKPLDRMKNKKKKVKKVHRNKVKFITVEDIFTYNDEESFVETLKIVDPQAKNVQFSVNTNTSNENIDTVSTSTIQHNKINNNKPEVIHTVAGTWFVSSDTDYINSNSISNVSSKKKKIHKDVENTFKTVETELKNEINKTLTNLNKVEVKQPIDKVKHECKGVDSDYLKISGKRLKTEFNEPLYEESKMFDKNSFNSDTGGYQDSNIKTDKFTKQVQNIDPTEFLKVTQTSLETEEMEQVEDHLDDNEENDQEKLIAEAFADDDIINEFK